MTTPIITDSIFNDITKPDILTTSEISKTKNENLDKHFTKKWVKEYFNNKPLIYEGKSKK